MKPTHDTVAGQIDRIEAEMKRIAAWIGEVLARAEDKGVQEGVRGQVRELCTHFPAPTTKD